MAKAKTGEDDAGDTVQGVGAVQGWEYGRFAGAETVQFLGQVPVFVEVSAPAEGIKGLDTIPCQEEEAAQEEIVESVLGFRCQPLPYDFHRLIDPPPYRCPAIGEAGVAFGPGLQCGGLLETVKGQVEMVVPQRRQSFEEVVPGVLVAHVFPP
jgi:hypothetical protein